MYYIPQAFAGVILMYTTRQYQADLKRSWQPVHTSLRVFGKKLGTLDPFSYFEPCLRMTARFILFTFQFAFFTARRLINH